MINEKKSLSMAEVSEVLKDIDETEKVKDMKSFIKKFSKTTPEKAKKLREDLTALDIIKIKQSDISKIIDLLPEDAQELNKLFTEVTLDAEETQKILDAIKSNK